MRWLAIVGLPTLTLAACLLPSTSDLGGGLGIDGGAIETGADSVGLDVKDSGGPTPLFFDDFARPDSPNLGNGWIAKQQGSFALQDGLVRWQGVAGPTYRDHLVYRPTSEDRRDVKAQLLVRGGVGHVEQSYPQIHVRMQRATVAVADVLDSYLLYVDGAPNVARLARQRGANFVVSLAAITISPPLELGQWYRMSLSASGTDPVQLVASMEVRDGNGGWKPLFVQATPDSDPERLTTAGSVGFSGAEGTSGAFDYDDFSVSLP